MDLHPPGVHGARYARSLDGRGTRSRLSRAASSRTAPAVPAGDRPSSSQRLRAGLNSFLERLVHLLDAPLSAGADHPKHGSDEQTAELLALDEVRPSVAGVRLNDVLAVDNLLRVHARRPYTGERKIVIGLADQRRWRELGMSGQEYRSQEGR